MTNKTSKIIQLPNRYRREIFLINNGNDTYTLEGDLAYMGYSFNDIDGKTVYYSVDPDGGPFMAVEHNLPCVNKEIESIDIQKKGNKETIIIKVKSE